MKTLIDYWLENVDSERIRRAIGSRGVYIWGAYFNGRTVLQWLEKIGIGVAGFIDGHKESSVYAEKRIFRPQEILGDRDCYIIVAVVGKRTEISDYLLRYNYQKNVDYLYISEEFPEVTIAAVKNEYRDCNGNEIIYKGEGTLQCHICLMGYNNKLIVGQGFEANSEFEILMENGATTVVGDYFRTEGRVIIEVAALGRLELGNNCYIMRDSRMSVKEEGTIIVGSYVTAGERFLAIGSKHSPVTIGNDCMFSHDVTILSTSGHSIFDLVKQENVANKKEKYVQIGDHVWLGKSAIVLYNSNIRKGCIVGAGSVVKGEFDENCVIAGNLAKVVSDNCTWDRRKGIEFGDI